MTIHELARRGVSGRQIARTLEVTEGTVRYHRRRRATAAIDGRSQQAFLASGWHEQIADWFAACEAADEAVNLVLLHAWLIKEAGYPGSLRVAAALRARAVPEAPVAGASAGGNSAGSPSAGRLGALRRPAGRRGAVRPIGLSVEAEPLASRDDDQHPGRFVSAEGQTEVGGGQADHSGSVSDGKPVDAAGAVDAQTRPPRLGQAADGLPTATTSTHLIVLSTRGWGNFR